MAELVIDVGMHNGSDTAYYLARGYDVVAVEANPELCQAARTRFAAEIEAGRLEIRNVGVADEFGELEFWISDHSEWSSFHEEHATMNGVSAHKIPIQTMPFAKILDSYRTPLFVKIDIELNDTLCLRALDGRSALPEFVSFEGHLAAAEDIDFLAGLGYRSFKCIRQIDWREITPGNVRRQGQIRKIIARTSGFKFLNKVLRRLHYRKSPVNGYQFATGSSGPLGRELSGSWMTTDQMLALWNELLIIDQDLNAQGLGEWFDIHATIRPAAPASSA
jgi:FkbM family methyltransferase